MPRVTAKIWTKGHVKDTLVAINNEISQVLNGGDPEKAILNIEKHITTLKQLHTPPATETGSTAKCRMPSPLRRRMETVIKRNEEFLEALRAWNPDNQTVKLPQSDKRSKSQSKDKAKTQRKPRTKPTKVHKK